MPLRVREVPKMQSINVTKTNMIFQIFSIPFFLNSIEWINAVEVNQGINDAFSTGSTDSHPSQFLISLQPPNIIPIL